MPDRIPLAPGIDAPDFVDEMLSVFGKNPYGEPIFRLIRSERKRIWFLGEVVPEYEYLGEQAWVLETWLDPRKDAGSIHSWGPMQEATLGPYPQYGTYNYVKQYPADWSPTEENVRLVCRGILDSRDLTMKQREDAIRDKLKAEEKALVDEKAEMILDSFDSAALGKLQAAVSGPKNNFRTAEDWERDRDRAAQNSRIAGLPKAGGAIYVPEN